MFASCRMVQLAQRWQVCRPLRCEQATRHCGPPETPAIDGRLKFQFTAKYFTEALPACKGYLNPLYYNA
jgi:hypothetical protein